MAVREATEADLAALLPLLRAYCDFYESNPSDEGLERMARGVIAAPEDQAFLLVAADEGGEVVGFAACSWKWSSLRGARIVYLDDLFVAEAARGSGHADALIGAVAEVARRHGAPVVSWLTAPDNQRAHAVYDRVGGHSETLLEYELDLGVIRRVVVWSGLDGWRAELAEVELEADGLLARGTQIGVKPMPYRADYTLDATATGSVTRSLRVEVCGEGWERRLRLERAESGEWTIEVGGEGALDLPAPGGDSELLAEALDCDLAFSPLTNAMPVRRHALDQGGAHTFLMAWVSLPDLAVSPSRQHYTHVSAGDRGSAVRYESESRDFVAELELDPDGLVRTYPQLARRVEAGEGPAPA